MSTGACIVVIRINCLCLFQEIIIGFDARFDYVWEQIPKDGETSHHCDCSHCKNSKMFIIPYTDNDEPENEIIYEIINICPIVIGSKTTVEKMVDCGLGHDKLFSYFILLCPKVLLIHSNY